MNGMHEPHDDHAVMVAKARTGIAGLDEITHGGLPAGRPTLVCGGPGCGKTILAMEFLVRGAVEFDEPGLFVSFEESIEDLQHNFRSFGFDLKALIEQKKLYVSHVKLSRNEIVEAGEFTLDGLFVRLEQAIQQVGAKRVALDTMETLFSCLSSSENLRSEIARLFQWLKEKGVTAVITGERGVVGAHPAWLRGVRLRLRPAARPPDQRAGLQAPPARRQVPWLCPRNGRVPVPHR